MNEPKIEWLADVEGVVAEYKGATPEAQQLICKSFREKYGEEAEAKARELFTPKFVRRWPPPKPENQVSAFAARLDAKVAAAKPINEAKPEPEPEPVSEEPAAKVEPPKEEPEPKAADVLVLSANAPYDTAKEFALRQCRQDGETVVWFWQGQFWRWNGRFYAAEPPENEITRAEVYKFLDCSRRWGSGGQTERFKPKPQHVNEVVDCLKTGLALGVECQPPMWLDTKAPATEWIAFRNGIVNVLTGEMRELSPELWVHSALGFDWSPDAACPTWDHFLDDVFPGDGESKQFIEEWMGYCMTEETRLQKGAMFVGPKRSGKGTISHVLRQMVGDSSYAGLSFNTWVSNENSRQPLIGKRVGVFADVRFKPGRAYGASFDPGGIGHVSAELLLNIIGEDTVTVPRKFIGAWHGQLRLKLIVISNEVPNLNDTSGVLPSRFVKVRFGVSFFGREDVNLREKLSGELSGIAARCVRAYQRLCERGRFVQPSSAAALEMEVLKASDPFTAMALECFVPDYAGFVQKFVAYSCFRQWCSENSRLDVLRSTPEKKFGEKLREVTGFEHIATHRPSGQPRGWLGIRIKKE